MDNRRDVATRKVPFFQNLAKRLVQLGLTPNQISIASSVFAILAGISLAGTLACPEKIFLYILAIVGIQLRLICNLIDGLMAVEGGLKTPAGEIFNDVPDRISDVAIIMGAGWAAKSVCPEALNIAWMASLLAVLTAYVRTLGAAMTGKHDFSGPMAKQHRMFLITLGCLAGIGEHLGGWPQNTVLFWILVMIALGSLFTCIHRLIKLYRSFK